MTTLTRRRSSRDEEPEEERDERPTRRRGNRRASDDMPDEERNTPRRGRRSRDEDEDERPSRGRRSSRSREDEDDDRPRRGARRSSSREDSGGSRRRGGHGGFASYSQKKRTNSNFADEFKPTANSPVLIKILDAEPFDVYNQHWVEEGDAAGKTRHSFVCLDDEYFGDAQEDGCPLCDVGESASTYSLFNILDLTNPRKPEVKVWKTSPAVTDRLERASRDDKTSPLNREDVYFEVEMVKKSKKTEWVIQPVKARDLEEDFDVEPFSDDELADFEENLFDDRKSITKVDDYDTLMDLADSLA